MKPYVFCLAACLLLFANCSHSSDTDAQVPEAQTEEQKRDDDKQENQDTGSTSAGNTDTQSPTVPAEEQKSDEQKTQEQDEAAQESTPAAKAFVTVYNASDFPISLYADPEHTQQLASLQPTESIQLEATATGFETAYYISYDVDIGIIVPWSDVTSFVKATPEEGKNVPVRIENPATMKTGDAYLLLENQTAVGITLKSGTLYEAYPLEKSIAMLNSGEQGIYRIDKRNLGTFPAYKLIAANGSEIPFPANLTALSSGTIYTVTVTVTADRAGQPTAALKAVTPFDIDTQKQIWSHDDSTFSADDSMAPLLRAAPRTQGGSYVMGTLRTDRTAVGLQHMDVYGNSTIVDGVRFQLLAGITVTATAVLDFAVRDDGAVVMLLQQDYTAADGATTAADATQRVYGVVCYDFAAKSLLWLYTFQDAATGAPSAMLFRADSRNKLVRTDDGRVAVCGAVLRSDGMHLYFAVFAEASGSSGAHTKTEYISSAATDSNSGIECMFTSACYDGADFYVCGYTDWDTSYGTLSHKGIVYRFTADKTSGGFSRAEALYEYERCLFFCIDGAADAASGGAAGWSVCGEYADSGKILKGCYLTSAQAAAGKAPATYTASERYCWFNQLCAYSDKIVLCGKTSADFAGDQSPLPFVAAFADGADGTGSADGGDGTPLWQNSFSGYSDAMSLQPNAIGTYLLQLRTNALNTMHYLSADLLGKEKQK